MEHRERAQKKFQRVLDNVVSRQKREVLVEYDASDFDQVLLIASASRGGSSLLFDILRHHEEICAPDGEHGKWYTLNGICYPEFESDHIPESYSEFNRQKLLTDLLSDVGATRRGSSDPVYIADNVVLRLPLQFPDRELPYQEIHQDLSQGQPLDEVLTHYGIELHNYDAYADGDVPQPISEPFVEERPFIVPHDHKRLLRPGDFEKTLLLKTSVDAYRLPWLREQVFPDTDLKIIHQTRNPASSINGLYDGWLLNRGFQTYDIGVDKEDYHGSQWNYDLPPEWERGGRLIDTCLQQWTSAQKHILKTRSDFVRVRAEDVFRDASGTAQKILDFAGLDHSELLAENTEDLNEVMATKEPQVYRWKNRESLIRSAFDEAPEQFNNVVAQLEYGDESEWI